MATRELRDYSFLVHVMLHHFHVLQSSVRNSFIMNLLFCLLALMYIHSVRVTSRTLRSDGNELSISEMESVRRIRPKSEDDIIWTKVELRPHRGVHIDLDGNEETNLQVSTEYPKSQHEKETSEEKWTPVETVETRSENVEPLRTEVTLLTANSTRNVSIEFDENHNLVAKNSSSNKFSDATNSTNTGNLSLLLELESGNFSDAVVLDFFDRNEHETVENTLIENISLKESVESNDALMREEDEIVFQEVPTFGFEFLIDSQTTRNLLVSELVSSESVLIIQDDSEELSTLLLDEESTTLDTVIFGLAEKGEFNSHLQSEETNALPGVEEFETENINLIESDVNSVVTKQNEITETITRCPDPGWCFLWFFSQDTCAEDNHCLGSRICCKSGCSKTCIDI